MPTPPILSIEQVTVRFGARTAVGELSLAVGRGELFGLLGPNGSGKSTTLSVVAGVLQPTSGTVRLCGRTLADDRRGYARQIGVVPQSSAVYDELSLVENLTFFGGLYGLHGGRLRRQVQSLLELIDLAEAEHAPVRTLSGGQRQRVNLACALLHDPPLLLLDEPTVALDRPAREQFFRHLDRLRSDGRAILLTTHHLDEVEHWCDRVGVLDAGRLVAAGPPSEILRPDGGRQVLEVRLAAPLDALVVEAIRSRIAPTRISPAEGTWVRLRLADAEDLPAALAAMMELGAGPCEFRTPPAVLEHWLSHAASPSGGVPCAVN